MTRLLAAIRRYLRPAHLLAPGDRVRVDTWISSTTQGRRGVIVGHRVLVLLEGDDAPTLMFPGEVVRE